MKVGLTFFLSRTSGSIWNSGAVQQCVFLWMLLCRCPGVERVFAVNGGDADSPAPGLMLGGLGIEFARPEDVLDEVDVYVEAGAQTLTPEMAERVRRRGGRTVSYKFGNAYVIETERVIHGAKPGAIVNGARFDEVWTNPQHANTCASYWEVAYRCPVRVLPQVWEPTFLLAAISEFQPGLQFGYRPRPGKKRVAIFEPNINIVKTCVVPMLACEVAHRERPDLLGEVYVTNAERIKDHLTFRKLAASLDVVRDGVCSFEGRFNFPWFMAKHADAVVSHQWECGLNFAYYDALLGDYPLVHNSPLLPAGVGYRYDGFDCAGAGRALVDALEHHDERLPDYRRSSKALLGSLSSSWPENVRAYSAALRGEAPPV
jgi:hypothetical protein